jgi:hypothetical protein
MAAMNRHCVELPIDFEGGAGTTRIVSREEVIFTTSACLTAGDRLVGRLPFPGEDGLPGLALYFRACVLLVAAPIAGDALREVHARFDRLDVAILDEE